MENFPFIEMNFARLFFFFHSIIFCVLKIVWEIERKISQHEHRLSQIKSSGIDILSLSIFLVWCFFFRRAVFLSDSVDISSLRSKQSLKWIIFFLLFSYAYLTDDMIWGLFFHTAAAPRFHQFSLSRTICRRS